ncbi:MAG: hypothetical protein ACRDO2_02040 [Nocardioidaceae bacterium]
MRVPFFVLDLRDAAHDLGVHQWALRSLLVLGVALTLVAVGQAGDGVGLLVPAILFAVAFWTAYNPDSTRPTFLIGLLLAVWLVSVDDGGLGWSLAAATGLLIVHAAAAYAAETPAGGRPLSSTHRRWALHTLVVAGLTTTTWAIVRALDGVDAPGRDVGTGAALLGIVVVALSLAVRTRPATPIRDAAVRTDRER